VENKNIYNKIDPGYYDKIFNKKNSPRSKWHKLKFKKINSIIRKYKPKNILDVGCGPGTFLAQLNTDANCHGIDIAKQQIIYASNKYTKKKLKFSVCDNAFFNFPDNYFDIITSIELIEHLSSEEIIKNLKEIKRCLCKDGYLIITTPNYKSFWPILEIIISTITSQNYLDQHISKFDKGSLRKLLNNNNFLVINLSSYLWISPFFSIINDYISNKIFNWEEKNFKSFGNLLFAICKNNK